MYHAAAGNRDSKCQPGRDLGRRLPGQSGRIPPGGPTVSLAWVVYFAPSDSNGLLPPIQYGTVPSGAQQLPDNPQPLQPGATYVINVAVWDTANGGAPVIVGRDTIIP